MFLIKSVTEPAPQNSMTSCTHTRLIFHCSEKVQFQGIFHFLTPMTQPRVIISVSHLFIHVIVLWNPYSTLNMNQIRSDILSRDITVNGERKRERHDISILACMLPDMQKETIAKIFYFVYAFYFQLLCKIVYVSIDFTVEYLLLFIIKFTVEL